MIQRQFYGSSLTCGDLDEYVSKKLHMKRLLDINR